MSVYILGLEMPEDGETVTLTICADGLVFEEFKEPGDVFHAVPVPEHGRLIDADALEKEAQKRMLICSKNDNQFQKPYEIMRAIALTPTIIPAEEVES